MQLSVLTYNIHKAIGTDRAYRLDRIIDLCREVQPDVIAMQEVPQAFRKANSEDSARLLAEALEMDYILGINFRSKRGSYGNATFSRFPIQKGQNLNITWSIKKPRGCLNSIIEGPDGTPFLFMNFHLGLSGFERRRQIHTILDSSFLGQHHKLPAIMLGDTNDVYDRLRRPLLKSGFREVSPRNTRESRTFPSYAPFWQLDRIYCNRPVTILEQRSIRSGIARVASDHLPVLVRLELDSEIWQNGRHRRKPTLMQHARIARRKLRRRARRSPAKGT